MKTCLENLSRTPLTARFAWFIAIWTALVSAHAATTPVPGDLVVSMTEFTGHTPTPTYIAEFNPAGYRVQTFDNVPMGGGTGVTMEPARDLVYGPGNAIYLYNGTFPPYLSRFDIAGGTWTHQTFTNWNASGEGALTRLGQYIYAADGIAPSGVVRFDTSGGPTVRFAQSFEPQDINIGPDGILYLLAGNGAPRNVIHKFDPITFASLGDVPVLAGDDHRALAVSPDGSILLAGGDSYIYRFSASGALMDYLFVLNNHFIDIDIDPNGRVALGTTEGFIVLTDLALDSYSKIQVSEFARSGNVFVNWVPEPSIVSLALVGILAIVVARKKTERGQPCPRVSLKGSRITGQIFD
jgi:hypothetical protein